MSYTPAQIRKTLVAAAGFVVNLLTVLLAVGGILPTEALPYVSVVLTLAGTYGVFAVKNQSKGYALDHDNRLSR